MAYIVIFECESPTVEASVTAAVKRMGEWAALSSQAYLVAALRNVRSMMETLQPLLGPNDTLWVFTPKGPWSGHGNPIVDDHLHHHLGEAEDYVPKDWDEASGSRR